jgi:DNA polymerase I
LINDKLQITDWKLTPSGMLNLERDYLDEKCKATPLLSTLNSTRKTIMALGKDTLSDRLVDNHVRAVPFIFSQKTGRCSPKPTKGFILNITPWLRSALIHPAPGEAFIGIDWSQQEIGIAAVLSGDNNLLEVYNSSDAYIALAIMAGAVPPDATKESHPSIRDNFKAVQLGIGYGKGVKSLAMDIWENNRNPITGEENMSREEALAKAQEIYSWHKRYFSVYWGWIKQNALDAKINGYVASVDNWILYCDRDTKPTQIQNFPMQANGASMLRRAVYHVWQTGVLELVCPLHDALYIRCQESEAERHEQLLGECMDKACREILGDTLTLKRKSEIYTHDKPYYDKRGWELYETIYKELGDVMAHPVHEMLRKKLI